jgi:hypothetical protein
MQTKLVRIDLANIPDPTSTNPAPLEKMINDASTAQKAAGFNLVSTFVFNTSLVLVFQK